MAGNLISSLLSPSVTIYNSTTGLPVISGSIKARMRVSFESQLMRHKLEDGSSITDSKIIRPVRLELDIFASTLDVTHGVNSIAIDRTSFYAISIKGLYFDWLMVESSEDSYSSKVLSSVPITLKFKQVILQNVNQTKYLQSANASLISKGISLLSSASATVSSVYSKVSSLF